MADDPENAGDPENSFRDAQGRLIILDEGIDEFRALHEGAQVGLFVVDVQEDEYNRIPMAYSIDVHRDYRRAGIGKRLVQMAFESLGVIQLPKQHGTMRDDGNYVTGDGAGLMRACQEEGWVSPFPEEIEE
jgi:GNAT superfamily N-acetyltransferase